MKNIDKALKIVQNTNDGNDLSPNHLYLVQQVVNGVAVDSELSTFEKLYQDVVIDNSYTQPWLCDIEHITSDHDGYIYYKGHQVEHYTFSAFASKDELKQSLTWLQQQCIKAEKLNLDINTYTIIWRDKLWADISDPFDPVVFYINNTPFIARHNDMIAIVRPTAQKTIHFWSVTDRCYKEDLSITTDDFQQYLIDRQYQRVSFSTSSDIKSFMTSTGLNFWYIDESAYFEFTKEAVRQGKTMLVPEETYDHFLECMPPLTYNYQEDNMSWFINSEPYSYQGNLTTYYAGARDQQGNFYLKIIAYKGSQ